MPDKSSKHLGYLKYILGLWYKYVGTYKKLCFK